MYRANWEVVYGDGTPPDYFADLGEAFIVASRETDDTFVRDRTTGETMDLREAW